MEIEIKNGRVIDPANAIDDNQSLFISDGKIVAFGRAPAGFTANDTIDAKGQIICPGLVDLRAHLREPGAEHKGTIASETRAAARGGITTLCCPPDTNPIIDTPAVVELIQRHAKSAGFARVVPLGALTQKLEGNAITEMHALKKAGCVGVSNAMRPIGSTLILRRAMEYAATHDLTVFIHAEDTALSDNGCVHEGAVGSRLGLPGIPIAAETVAVAATLALVEETGARVHFSMVSSKRALQKISRAKFEGQPVTCDVSAHHLHLTEIDLLGFNSQCHVRPPLRTQRDMEGLRKGIADGVVAAICSDHQPHEADAKLAPFGATESGISALETLLPLALRVVDDGILTISQMINSLTHQPAAILGVEAGTLSIGQRADICIFDPERYWTLDGYSMLSRGHNTPFLNWEMKGEVTRTLLGGKTVYECE
ncbi:MAG: dihydroorotase [Thiotrichaceae bacterium]|nr:dihydroorotase [Thiotrichaceae bacterium]